MWYFKVQVQCWQFTEVPSRYFCAGVLTIYMCVWFTSNQACKCPTGELHEGKAVYQQMRGIICSALHTLSVPLHWKASQLPSMLQVELDTWWKRIGLKEWTTAVIFTSWPKPQELCLQGPLRYRLPRLAPTIWGKLCPGGQRREVRRRDPPHIGLGTSLQLANSQDALHHKILPVIRFGWHGYRVSNNLKWYRYNIFNLLSLFVYKI